MRNPKNPLIEAELKISSKTPTNNLSTHNPLNETGKLVKICTCGAYKIAIKHRYDLLHCYKGDITYVKRRNRVCTCGAYAPPKPKMPAGVRRLKIQQKYVNATHHYVSSLLLAGKWLEALGFAGDKYIVIKEEFGRLVIELEALTNEEFLGAS